MTQNAEKSMVGAVLIFSKGTDVNKAQAALDEIFRRGVLEQPATAHEYNSRFGGPVWYIP